MPAATLWPSGNSPQGKSLWTGQTRLSEYFEGDYIKIVNVKIDEITIENLLEQHNVKVTTVF